MPTSGILLLSPAQMAFDRGSTALERPSLNDASKATFERTLGDFTASTPADPPPKRTEPRPDRLGADADSPAELSEPDEAQNSETDAQEVPSTGTERGSAAAAQPEGRSGHSSTESPGDGRRGSTSGQPGQHHQPTSALQLDRSAAATRSSGSAASGAELKPASPSGAATAPPSETPTPSTQPPITGRSQSAARGGLLPSIAAQARLHPAAVRARQVQNAVRVENVTGQAPTTDLGAKAGQPVTAVPSFVAATVDDGSTPPSSPSSSGSLLDGDRVSGRIVRGLSALVNQRGGVMHMRLDPPDLGVLRVQMTIARGAVTAEFQPTTVQAHALLEQGLGVLRSALESHGLVVDRLTVQAAPSLPSAPLREDASDQSHQHQQGSGDGRFSEADRESGGDAREDDDAWGGSPSRHEQLGELPHQEDPGDDRRQWGGHSRETWARGPAWSLLRAFASSTPA